MATPELPASLAALGLAPARHYVGGVWRAGEAGALAGGRLPLADPSDGTILFEIARGSAADVDAAVAAAREALAGRWGACTAAERGRLLARMREGVLGRAEALAEAEAHDVGKPLAQARSDVAALARYLEFYAGAADKLHGQTIPTAEGCTAFTQREPHGVTAHVVPWNYPMQIIGRSVGAALATGNACVLKPAEDACLTALAFAQVAHEAGLPAGALNLVTGLGEEAGAALVAHPGVRHVSFTGSFEVGQRIQAVAARNVVPVTLELGGKSAMLVFDDADLEAALPVLVNAGIQNAGQTCSAASRVLVQRGVYARVLEAMAARYAALRVGPALSGPDVGPLISARQRQRVEHLLAGASASQVVARTRLPADLPVGGHYFAPTLLADVPPSHALAQEEIFGPVQLLMPFDDEAEALALANGTRYGLVAGVWTADGSRALRLARRLEAGQVFINHYGAGGGIELPFGGVRHSGHGREKGFEALYAFTAAKTVSIRHG